MSDMDRKLLPPEHPTLGTSMGPTWKSFTAGVAVLSFGIYGYLMNRGGIGEWDDWIVVWGFLIMGSLFTLAGWAGMSDRRRRRALKMEFCSEPWRYDRRWEVDGVRQGLEFLKFSSFPFFTGGKGEVEYRPGNSEKEIHGLQMILRCVTEEWAKGKPVKGEPSAKCYELYSEVLEYSRTTDGYRAEFTIPADGKADLFCCEPVVYWEVECRDIDNYAYFFPIPVYHKENPDAEEKYKL